MPAKKKVRATRAVPAGPAAPRKVLWLVWHVAAAAWANERKGVYTRLIRDAQRFTYHEARARVEQANYGQYNKPVVTMVPDYI